VIISVPVYLAIEIEKTKSGYFKAIPTKLGQSKYFSIYSIALFILVIVFPLVAATIINSISMYRFKKILETKANLTNKSKQCKNAELRYSMCVFILAAISILSRSLDMVGTIFNRLLYFYPEIILPENVRWIVLSKSVTNLIMFTVNALDGLIYLKMDNNLWQLVFKRFKRLTNHK